jgi:hypothetical protein
VAQQRYGSQQGNHYFTMPMKINFIGKALWIDVVAYMLPTLFDRYMLVNNTLMINGVFMHFIFRAQWWWYQPGMWGVNPADHHEEINPDPAPEVKFPFNSLWYLCALLSTT